MTQQHDITIEIKEPEGNPGLTEFIRAMAAIIARLAVHQSDAVSSEIYQQEAA